MHIIPFRWLRWAVLFVGPTEDVLAQTTLSPVGTTRPVAVWPAGPLNVVVAFEKGVEPASATLLVGKSIRYFEPAGPAAAQAVSPRPPGSLRIVGARLTDSGRTLTLATDPHPAVARYVLPLTSAAGQRAAGEPAADEMSYDLCGVEAAWTAEGSPDAQPTAAGWWPLLDLEATRRLTRGSKRHEDELALLSKPGRLVLGTLVRLPKGSVTVNIESSQPIDEASLGDVQAEPVAPASATETHRALLTVSSQGGPLFLSITCRTGVSGQPFALKATYRAADDKTDHAFARQEMILPWAPVQEAAAKAPIVVPPLAGGDSARGQTIFNGELARCSQCHTFRGQGGKVGPDLTEIGKKGRAEIYRAIAAPSASIDPAFMSYSVATKTGQVVVGLVRAEGADAISVTDTNAHGTLLPRQEIEQIRPSANSIMPVGLTGALGEAAVRDLIAFLTDDRGPTDRSTAN
jgi:putative heme-binding domain-containing protein